MATGCDAKLNCCLLCCGLDGETVVGQSEMGLVFEVVRCGRASIGLDVMFLSLTNLNQGVIFRF
jgi:hypothetical protein